MSDRLVAWLRTVVPVAWSALVAWLISLGAPAYLTDALGDAGELLVVLIVVGVVYPLARSAETHLPAWLTRVLLGSAKSPTYSDARPPLDG